MTYPSQDRAIAHMRLGYRSFDVGAYVRVECQNGHSHYLAHEDFKKLSGLAEAATQPHPDTRQES